MVRGLLVVLVVTVVGVGCAGSKVQTVALDVPKRSDEALYLLPFEPPKKVLVAKDRNTAGDPLQRQLMLAIKSASSAYDYTFDEGDIRNLRTSLVRSLQVSRSFATVQDLSSTPDPRPARGLFLTVRLEEAGMRASGGSFAAIIKGTARIEDSRGLPLGAEVAIDANETGLLTVAQSKNQAIASVITQIGKLLGRQLR